MNAVVSNAHCLPSRFCPLTSEPTQISYLSRCFLCSICASKASAKVMHVVYFSLLETYIYSKLFDMWCAGFKSIPVIKICQPLIHVTLALSFD
jgi:hypothetical protein